MQESEAYDEVATTSIDTTITATRIGPLQLNATKNHITQKLLRQIRSQTWRKVAKNKRSALLSAGVASPRASAGLGPYEPCVQFDRSARSIRLWLGIHAVEFAKEHPPEFALILREMAQGQNLSEGADFSIAEFPLRRSLNFFKDHLACAFSPISSSRRDSRHGACFPNSVAAR
jgi:hypothetical protein